MARSAFEAEDLWLGLHSIIGDVVGESRGRRSKGPKSPLPINVHTDALLGDLEDRCDRAAEVVAERLRVVRSAKRDRHERVVRDARLIAANVDELVRVPVMPVSVWARSGESWDVVEADGVDLALDVWEVASLARSRLGVTRKRDRLPVPCPRCEHHTLGRWAGGDAVTCTTCHASWSESEYRRLVLVLSDDYRDLV